MQRQRLSDPGQSHLILYCPTVQLRTISTTRFLTISRFSTISGPVPGELPGFWGFMVFHHAPIRQKGSGNNKNSDRLFRHTHAYF